MRSNDPVCIGITGGIGSGKSTVCEVLKILGYPVYHADNRAKRIAVENQKVKEDIIALFGQNAYVNQVYNTSFIANKVFDNEELLGQLNNIVHPAVADDFNGWIWKQESNIVFKEAALLFESGSYKSLDKTVLILSPEELRIQRITGRDPQRNSDQVRSIIQRQMDPDHAAELADWTLINDEQKPLLDQVLELNLQIRQLN